MDKLLFTVEEAEEMTAICRSKLYEFMASGTLRSVKIGRSRRIARVDLEAFIDRLRAEQTPLALSAA
ncbi:MAG TPA: helix-turn-helix domain-containing protein [Thermomicrobiales bacterium]